MSKLARILAVVFLAVFAVGTAAHAAVSTDMSLKMASMADEGMADCQDCPGDGGQVSVCDQFCLLTFAAICAPAGAELPNTAELVAIRAKDMPGGEGGPPDPYPPRTIL